MVKSKCRTPAFTKLNMDNLTVIVPFWNGHQTIEKLIASIPETIPIVIVDDLSDEPYQTYNKNVRILRAKQKGYFTGAVNHGIDATQTDVLILNQDAEFTGTAWLDTLAEYRTEYGLIGERIGGKHPAWPLGYIHGTFMFIRRDVIDKVGKLNARDYPLWGSTCEYQLRSVRAGFDALMLKEVPAFIHKRQVGKNYGESITEALYREPDKKAWFIRTPPEISVIIPTYNQGRFLFDAVNSLVGGETSLGYMPGQTFQSFEVIIVDDCSPDETQEIGQQLADPAKAIYYIRRPKNGGTPAANNSGIRKAHGRFITILCADDMMEPDRLDTFYSKAIIDPSKVYYDDPMTFTDGKRVRPMTLPSYNFERLLFKNHMHAGIFYLRDAWEKVGGYPEVMKEGREDWAMNIALGRAGYCGQKINGYSGYLYRRQDHNRTLQNTTPKFREYFLRQLTGLFPDLYNGARPEMCCGDNATSKKTKPTAAAVAAQSARIVPMSGSTVTLEYVGTSFGSQSFYGPITGARYKAGLSRKLVPVDRRDLNTSKGRGLLDLSEGNRKLFKIWEPPAVKEEPVKVDEPLVEEVTPDQEPEPVEVAATTNETTTTKKTRKPRSSTSKSKASKTTKTDEPEKTDDAV